MRVGFFNGALALCFGLAGCDAPGRAAELSKEDVASLAECASSAVPIRPARTSLVWKEGLLQITAANHTGKLAIKSRNKLLVFADGYGSHEEVALDGSLSALAVSADGRVAWLESDKSIDYANSVVHLFYQGKHTVGPAITREPYRVPRTWPELYFVDEHLNFSDQRGRLVTVEVGLNGPALAKDQVRGSDSVDMTAALGGQSYLQYKWNTAAERGPQASSSVSLVASPEDLRIGRAARTSIALPLRAWVDFGDRLLILTLSAGVEQVTPRVHLVRKSDGEEVAHLAYNSTRCNVTSIDTDNRSERAAILVSRGLIQIVDTKTLRVLDQIGLPHLSDYSVGTAIVSIAQDKYLVTTAGGIVLVDAR